MVSALARFFRWISLLILVCLFLEPTLLVAKDPSGKQPLNVLVIITDQHHADWLQCAGHPVVKTPNLDRLAREGTRFTQAYVPAPFCSPTRISFETSLYPSSMGIGHNIKHERQDPLRLREPQQVYQHSLAALGYNCHQLGKWHLGDPAELNCFPEANRDDTGVRKEVAARLKKAGPKAFDDGPRPGETELIGDVYLPDHISAAHRAWRNEKGIPAQDVGVIGRLRIKPEFHFDSVLANHCIDLIREHGNKPFAITYSVEPPHAPWVAPSPFYDMYDPKQFTLPASWKAPTWTNSASTRMGRIYGEAGLREYLRCYAAQISMVDWCVGRILNALDNAKLTDNTLVIFVSDHGNMLGQHGMMDKTHGTFYDDLVRVPLIMRLPGQIGAGTTNDAFVSATDLAPTILDYLGARPMAKSHGRSLRRILSGDDKGPDAVYSERGQPSGGGASRMIRTREWKLCILAGGSRELYNLKADPGECNNVAADPANAKIVRQLEKRLLEHMREIADPALANNARRFGAK